MMEWKKIIPILDRYFQKDRCLERVRAIWETDHWIDYSRYVDTAKYCARSMEQAGLKAVELLPLRADGKTAYGDWVIPRAWKVDHGTLRYADGELIADYHQVPCSLSMYCPSTNGAVEGEVLDVTGLTELPKDGSLKGKILLSDRSTGLIASMAKGTGAIGAISDGVPLFKGIRDSKEEIYDACVWQGMSWKDPSIFGFKLTPRQGDRLREELKNGPVRLVADVQAELYDGVSNTVSGVLQGREPALPELFAYGHLYEPGANDNASGCAALLELAAAIEEAIAAGELPRPKRSIRFAMGDECNGSMGYVTSYPEREMLAGGVFDMVGTEDIDRTKLALQYNPFAHWSYCEAALELSVKNLIAHIGRDPEFIMEHFSDGLGTDNIICDPCFNVPSVGLVASPATSYHTSMDTPDRIEGDILKRNALILGAYIYGLADADGETCKELEQELRALAAAQGESAHPRKKRQVEEALDRALYSLRRIEPSLPFEAPQERSPEKPAYAEARGDQIPERLVKGCLTLQGRPELKNPRFRPAWNAKLNIPLFWTNGERTLWEIAVQTALELDLCSDEAIQEKFEELCDYYDFLAEWGYIRWKN